MHSRRVCRVHFVILVLSVSIFEASAAVCGDRLQEGNEQCEDGNTVRAISGMNLALFHRVVPALELPFSCLPTSAKSKMLTEPASERLGLARGVRGTEAYWHANASSVHVRAW